MSKIRLYRERKIKSDFWVSIPEEITNPKIIFWFTGSIRFDSSSGKFLYSECENQFVRGISLFENYIVITPCFPRIYASGKVTTSAQDLSIDTMFESQLKEKFAIYNRADLEVLKIFNFVKEEFNINHSTFDVGGISSGSCFSNIFSILHSEYVDRCFSIIGGHQLLPFGEVSQKLKYPFGISDISEIEGIEINQERIKKIKFFIYEGVKDMNDPVEHYADYDKNELVKIREHLGETRIKRTQTWVNIMKDFGCEVQSHYIDGLEHRTGDDLGKLIDGFIKF